MAGPGIIRVYTEDTENQASSTKGTPQHFPTSKKYLTSPRRVKGLSFRSKSDINVSQFNQKVQSGKQKWQIPDKQIDFMKENLRSPKSKLGETLKENKSLPNLVKAVTDEIEEFVFKKPTTPKRIISINECSEPESLAFCTDYEKLLDEEIDCIFEADRAFMRRVIAENTMLSRSSDSESSEDEGFISLSDIDETHISSFEANLLNVTDWPLIDPPELPDISDDEF